MEINSGRLSFNPNIQSAQVSPSAVDLCLSNQFTVLHPSPNGEITHLDLTRLPSIEDTIGRHATEVTVPQGQCFTLEPKAFVLAYTREYVKLPNYLAARIEGRSSLARIGISIHQTAPTVHATFEGQLRLEIINNGPFACELRPGMKFCQLVVERLGSPAVSTLRSPFQRQQQGTV